MSKVAKNKHLDQWHWEMQPKAGQQERPLEEEAGGKEGLGSQVRKTLPSAAWAREAGGSRKEGWVREGRFVSSSQPSH